MDNFQKEVEQLLTLVGVQKAPVPVESIAEKLGAEIRYSSFEGNVSGMFIRKDDEQIIGVNTHHPANRQRFTIAHEIAHMFLHKDKDLFIDSQFQVFFRGGEGTPKQEREANQFAAELLMPTKFLMEDLRTNFDFESDEQVAELSKKYKVSVHAMTIRLAKLSDYIS